MRKALLLAALLLCVWRANATPALVQSCALDGTGTGATTAVVQLQASSTTCTGSASAAGNILVIMSYFFSGSLTPTIADTLSITYGSPTVILRSSTSGSPAVSEAIWCGANASGGNDTITETYGGSLQYSGLYVAEFSGATCTVDATSTGLADTAAGSVTTGNISTTASGDVLVSVLNLGGGASVFAGSGYTLTWTYAEYQIAGAAGTYNASFSVSPNQTLGNVLAAFKAGASSTRGGSVLAGPIQFVENIHP